MKTFLKFIITLAFFSVIIIYYNKSSDTAMEQSKQLLHNNIEFEGFVTDFEESSNHGFGVIYLELTKSNIQDFNKIPEKGIYPYRINEKTAELYCTVFPNIKKGDTIKTVSNEAMIYYNPQESDAKAGLYIIHDFYNIGFVKENTKFK
jgi:hypothetical protein